MSHEKEQKVKGDSKALAMTTRRTDLLLWRWSGVSGFCRVNYEFVYSKL